MAKLTSSNLSNTLNSKIETGEVAGFAYTQANAANQYANSAYAKANTVASDLANFSSLYAGIETTQNTRITNVETLTQSAFNQANTTAGGLTTANSNITTADTKAQAAFDKANTAITTSGGTITGSLIITNSITGNVSIATNSSAANSIGYLGVPQSNLNPMSVSYTLAISDMGEHLYMVPADSTLTVNIPSNASVPFPIGTAIVTILDAGFKSNVVPQTGVTLRLAGNTAGSNVSRTLSEYSMASLVKVGTDVWYISGAGVT